MSKNVQIILLLFLLTVFFTPCTYAQRDSLSNPDTFSIKKLRAVVISEAVLYAGAMVGLNELWYKDYPRSGFHFFNDNREWLQMDKAGHVATSYYVGYAGMAALKWAGVEKKKSIWYG